MASRAPRRLIAHLDMDAFYASVELLRYPELRGQAVVIGGGRRHQPQTGPDGTRRFSSLAEYTGRGVVTTATYEARAHGVHSGMGLMKAAALAPKAVLLPTDFDEYRRYSRLFKAAVAEIAPVIEDRGIDEIYIDLTDVPGAQEAVGHDPLGGARAIAQEIKNNVRRSTGLVCSIGLAENKLVAKIASDLDKPDGLAVVMADDVTRRLWPLPVRRINGIGPKSAARLAELGIHTIGDLAALPRDELVHHFGASHGGWMAEAARGRDDRAVVTHSEPVSISRETTFDRDLHPRNDRAELGRVLDSLCERVAQDLQRKGYLGRTVGLKLRFDDFRTVTRDHTLPQATDEAADIRAAAGQCARRVPLTRRIRLMGVRVGHLHRAGEGRIDPDSSGAPAARPAMPAAAAAPARPARRAAKADAGAAEAVPGEGTLPLFDSDGV